MKRIILLFVFSGLLMSVFAQDTQNAEWETYLQGFEINDIADAGTNLWLIVDGGSELTKLDKESGDIETFDCSDFNIENDWFLQVECDKEGFPWVGTFSGLFKLNENKEWIQLHNKPVADIQLSKDGCVWVSFGDEILKYKEDLIEVQNFNSAGMYFYVSPIVIDEGGNLWGQNYYSLPMYGDLVNFDGQNWTTFHLPEYYYDDFFVPDSEFPKTNLKHTFFINDIKVNPDNEIWMAKTKVIWDGDLVTQSDGTARYPSKSVLESFRDSSWTTYLPPVETRINSIEPDKMSIWCATDDGLMIFNSSQWTVYSTKNSALPSDHVNSIVSGNDGTIWLGTDNGLVSMKMNEAKSLISGVDSKNETRIKLYPNPAHDFIRLELSAPLMESQISIVDLCGRTLKEITSNEGRTSIDLTDLTHGIYLLKVESGTDIFTQKFVKQ